MFIHIFIKIFNNKGIVIPRILSQLKNTTLSFVKCVLRSKMRHLRRIYKEMEFLNKILTDMRQSSSHHFTIKNIFVSHNFPFLLTCRDYTSTCWAATQIGFIYGCC